MGAVAVGLLLTTLAARAQEEVPFITTPDNVTVAMLELAGVKANDHVVDLGSGDGRIVITAARRFGATGLGVEIVPDLVVRSREFAHRAGVASRTEFRQQDLFAPQTAGDLARATVVTMYLLPDVNLQLRPQILKLAPGTRIVSHDWDMGEWEPERTLVLDVPDKAIGREKKSRVHLWIVPASAHGLWCAPGATLEVTQRFQRVSATMIRTQGAGAAASTSRLVFDGRIGGAQGRELSTHAGASTQVRMRVLPEGIDWLGSSAAQAAGLAGVRFRKANANVCPPA